MPTPPSRTAPRLASDNARATVASLIALGATFVVSFAAGFLGAAVFGLHREDLTGPRVLVLVYFGFWIGYSVLYLALTWRVFHRADAETLGAWMRESDSARRARRRREMLVAGSGPVGAISFAGVAVLAVVVVAVVPALRRDPVVVGLAVVVVAVSWLLLVSAYAVHYAREEVHTQQLEFTGEPPGWYDYVYLAVQISTTFSSSDVTVSGTAMRRAVSAHAVVAFAFNTVIIALLVSLLLAGIT